MAKARRITRPGLLALAAGIAAATLLASPFLVSDCDVCEAATSILVGGTVQGRCTINVVATGQAADLPIDISGAHRVQVGSVQQNCNGRATYVVMVTSTNCAAAPTGGKVLNPEAGEFVAYSVEFNNPTTGWSDPVVTGLLASNCSYQIGRLVLFGRIRDETSTVYLNFSGVPELAAGTYQDILTISLTVI